MGYLSQQSCWTHLRTKLCSMGLDFPRGHKIILSEIGRENLSKWRSRESGAVQGARARTCTRLCVWQRIGRRRTSKLRMFKWEKYELWRKQQTAVVNAQLGDWQMDLQEEEEEEDRGGSIRSGDLSCIWLHPLTFWSDGRTHAYVLLVRI